MRARSGSAIKKVYTSQIAARKADAWVFDQERDVVHLARKCLLAGSQFSSALATHGHSLAVAVQVIRDEYHS